MENNNKTCSGVYGVPPDYRNFKCPKYWYAGYGINPIGHRVGDRVNRSDVRIGLVYNRHSSHLKILYNQVIRNHKDVSEVLKAFNTSESLKTFSDTSLTREEIDELNKPYIEGNPWH